MSVRPVNFVLGDYILVGYPQLSKAYKRTVRWSGPTPVVDFILPLVSVVKDSLSGKKLKIHVARLKIYHESSPNADGELTAYMFHQN